MVLPEPSLNAAESHIEGVGIESRSRPDAPPRRGRPWVALFRVVLGTALLAFVLSRTGGSASETLGRLLDAPLVLLALFGIPFLGNPLEAARLALLVQPIGVHLRLLPTCGVVAVSTLFNYVVPGGTGGDVMKLYYVGREHRGRLTEVATALLADRAIALFALLLVILGLAAMDVELVRAHAPLGILVASSAAGVLVLAGLGLLSGSERLRSSRLYRFLTTRAPLHHQVARLGEAVLAFRQNPRAVFGAMGLCVVGHAMLVWVFVLLGRVIVPDVPAISVGLLSLLGMLANAIPLTPAGLGVGEAAFERLFQMVGHAGGAFIMVAWRLGLVPISLVGFVIYVAGLRDVTRTALERP